MREGGGHNSLPIVLTCLTIYSFLHCIHKLAFLPPLFCPSHYFPSSSPHYTPKFFHLSHMYLTIGLVCLTAFEVVAEQQRSELPVLMFDVILHSSLARSAQLVGLLQVVLVHLNLLIIFVLVREQERKSR